jgi:putative intracellular protease/amidase
MGGLAANAPWLLEDRLRAAGALFEAGIPFGPHVVMDGNLITGQNPGSANAVTRAVLGFACSTVKPARTLLTHT